MALCPKCKCRFRTLEDEEGMHACPRCGYDGHEPKDPDDEWESPAEDDDDEGDTAA